jgi:hypothetical protein
MKKQFKMQGYGGPYNVTLIEEGDEYGPHCLVYEGDFGPLVEFTDASPLAVRFPVGVFLSLSVPWVIEQLRLSVTEEEVKRLRRWLEEVIESEPYC